MGLPFPLDLYDSLTTDISRVGQRLAQRGFCAGSDGNISARLDDDLIVITPSGVAKGEMRPDSMCVLRLSDGSLVHGRNPSSERRVHLTVYGVRPDVEAVVHAHSPKATCWACTGLPVPLDIHPEAALMLGRVPIVPYETPGTSQLAEAVARHAAGQTAALLLANHGALALGRTLEEAVGRLEVLEAYCELLIHLRLLGVSQRLPEIGA